MKISKQVIVLARALVSTRLYAYSIWFMQNTLTFTARHLRVNQYLIKANLFFRFKRSSGALSGRLHNSPYRQPVMNTCSS